MDLNRNLCYLNHYKDFSLIRINLDCISNTLLLLTTAINFIFAGSLDVSQIVTDINSSLTSPEAFNTGKFKTVLSVEYESLYLSEREKDVEEYSTPTKFPIIR